MGMRHVILVAVIYCPMQFSNLQLRTRQQMSRNKTTSLGEKRKRRECIYVQLKGGQNRE